MKPLKIEMFLECKVQLDNAFAEYMQAVEMHEEMGSVESETAAAMHRAQVQSWMNVLVVLLKSQDD